MNMSPNVAAGVSYILFWITGLIIFLMEKNNRFVRFNAMQAIILGAIAVVNSVVIGNIPFLGYTLYPLIWLAIVVIWIICMVNAFQGKTFKIPVIGDYAEKFANPTPTPTNTPPTY